MPLQTPIHIDSDNLPYFDKLEDLDKWSKRPPLRLDGVIPYIPRVLSSDTEFRGKLLVCHDYKGGYKDTPDAPSYTFNFWQYTDTFIYFSHHRVTIPPPGWVNASHRQGVPILGTLIFEHDSSDECLRLVSGPHPCPPENGTYYVSPHYARVLAELARQRGFDGYLLNFESPLKGRVEQTRALAAWVAVLTKELKSAVGAHAECVWYDSVIIDGNLRWQNRLNSLNLPFFIPSSSFFANYSWPTHYPLLTAQYYLSLEEDHVASKRLNDVYFGVDVWGRGSHGGGGFGSHKAISHIDPESLGLSVALFGQAWTWETEQDKPGFTWDTWWAYDRLLWLGAEKEGEIVQITEPTTEPVKGQEEECVHGTFTPIASFFTRKPPPNPSLLPFFTSFSPGVGFAWFVDGKRVFQAEHGWTDVDKCTSLGDLIWPNSSGPGACGDPGLKVVTSLSMEDAWLGGSSLRIVLSLPQTTNDTINTHWLPIQSLSITPRRTYNLSLTLKLASMSADFDIELSIREIVSEGTGSQIALSKRTVEGLPSNWSQHSLQFDVASESASDLHCAVGITIRSKNPSARDVTILLGALSAYLASTSTSILQQRISYVNFERETLATQPPPPFSGFLEWSNSAYMAPLPGISLESEEDPHPAWTTDPSYPSFLYYNIYFSDPAANQDPIFLGTSGFDGAEKRFHIDSFHPVLPIRPEKDGELRSFRFHVQGITNHGDVLPWDQCSHTDVTL